MIGRHHRGHESRQHEAVDRWFPLSYQVDALRSLMLSDMSSSFGIAPDFAVLVGVTVVLVLVAGRLYPRLAR
jgi:ABC-2 type transport system permease protein